MARGKKQNLTSEELIEQALVPENEQPFQVPENWKWVKLDSIVNVATGKKDANYGTENGRYMFFTCAAEPIRCDNYSFEGESILLAGNGANVGLALYYNGQFEAYQRTYVLQSRTKLSLKYIYYHLNRYWKEYNADKQYGSATNYIKLGNFQEYPIPLPPLAEQLRIVDRIESLFAKLDQAKELAQNALDSFETRKAAILHKVFTGELTAKWREEHGVGMDSWEEKTFGELGNFRLGKMLDRVKNKGESTKYLRNVNVRWFDFDLSDISEMAVTEDEKAVYSIKTGDLLICEGGEPGRCAVWEQETCDLIYQKALHRFRTNGSVVTRFLAYYIFFISKTDKLSQYFTGTTIKHLTGRSLAKISIPLPSIPEQEEIVRILDNSFRREESANDRCDIIDQINLMKKSILARAFRGELGTNDPSEESSLDLLKEVIVAQ